MSDDKIILREGPRNRPAAEIQRAHDLLTGLLTRQIPNPAPRFTREILMYSAVLCWVLNDGHDKSFGSNLERIERELRAGGFELDKYLAMRAVAGPWHGKG